MAGIVLFSSMLSACAFESSQSLIKEGATLNLSDCIRVALDNSPNIKKAAYNYKISNNDVSLAKSGFFPTIGIGTGYYWNGTYMKQRDVENNYYNLSKQLDSKRIRGFKAFNRRKNKFSNKDAEIL